MSAISTAATAPHPAPTTTAPGAAPTAAPAPLRAPSASGRWWLAAVPRRPWLWAGLLLIAAGWDRAAWIAASRFTAPTTEALEAMSVRAVVDGAFSWHAAEAARAIAYAAYHAVKAFGTAWLAAAVAAWIVLRALVQPDAARVRVALRRGVLLFLSAASAGLLAEGLKLVFRRQRPELADGLYAFRFSNFWNASGLGLPSSHAAVAAGAAVALGVLWPRRRWVWFTLAALCIVGRVLSGAHFLSDALLGTLVGLAAARAVVALDLRNNDGRPVPA